MGRPSRGWVTMSDRLAFCFLSTSHEGSCEDLWTTGRGKAKGGSDTSLSWSWQAVPLVALASFWSLCPAIGRR